MSAPRVTIEDVENSISDATYTLLADGRTTICQIIMKNGFSVIGQSTCASIENFNEELGNRLAYLEAKMKIWQLLGFSLVNQLSSNPVIIPLTR